MINEAKTIRKRKELFQGCVLLEDVEFSSASSVAQFITRYSVNGLNDWHEEETESLERQ